jgi:hypothetical protein
MSEGGLSAAEVGKELEQHRAHTTEHEELSRRDRIITIIEASILAVVALLAAWSGFSSAKWSTESRLLLAQSSTARAQATRDTTQADVLRNFDASTFNAWFSAYVAGNQKAMDLAVRRFRPQFKVAFDAWLATNPETNPNAPPGPSFMPQYDVSQQDQADKLDAHADDLYIEAATAGTNADEYIRITVFLATVLFLVGISSHFKVRGARYGLVTVGSAILIFALVLIIAAPRPPH